MRSTWRNASAGSLITQRLDGTEPRRPPRGIEGGEEGQAEGHRQHRAYLVGVDARRYLREEIDLGREQIGPDDRLDELADLLDMRGERDPQHQPGERAEEADRGARQHKYPQDHAAGRAHGAQDR